MLLPLGRSPSPALTCLSISCLVLFSSSYLIFHWLSSPSSFSMFLLSASLSLERGGEVDMGVSPLRLSVESPPARPMPGEPVSEVLGSAFKALEPHTVAGTPILHSFGSWTPHPLHNCRCPGTYVQGVHGCGKVTRTPRHWLCLAKNLMFNCQIGPLFLFYVLGLPVHGSGVRKTVKCYPVGLRWRGSLLSSSLGGRFSYEPHSILCSAQE